MKKYLIVFLIFKSVALYAADTLAFDLRPETVMFSEVSYHLADSQSPKLVKKTIVGRFYQEELPAITAGGVKGDFNLTPFILLSEMLTLIQDKDYGNLSNLYSVETRKQVSDRLKDPEVGPQIREWLSSLKTLEILGTWLESPNLLIAYVQVNGDERSIRPYVFEFNDGWHLRAGHFDSEFSNQLDAFYTKHTNGDMTVAFPPTLDEMSSLLSDTGLVSLIKDMGLDIL